MFQISLDPTFLKLNNFFTKNFFNQIFFQPKFFRPKIVFQSKDFLDQNLVFTQKVFKVEKKLPNSTFDPGLVSTKKTFYPNEF